MTNPFPMTPEQIAKARTLCGDFGEILDAHNATTSVNIVALCMALGSEITHAPQDQRNELINAIINLIDGSSRLAQGASVYQPVVLRAKGGAA